jgi:hypothetical protein
MAYEKKRCRASSRYIQIIAVKLAVRPHPLMAVKKQIRDPIEWCFPMFRLCGATLGGMFFLK